MSILISEDLKENLAQDLKQTENNISIITAFCKKEALEYIDKQLKDKEHLTKRILVRFELDDILSKATDLEIYDYCKNNNWKLYVQFNLHAKVYSIDKKICYMGSANATNKGLSLKGQGNLEMTKRFKLDEEEKMQIEKVFFDAIVIDDKMFNEMKQQVETTPHKIATRNQWRNEIIERNIKSYQILFQDDFPINDSPIQMIEDEIFLNIHKENSIEEIKEKFYHTRIIQWLVNLLEAQENKEMYFGELSEKIHNSIFQEPKQYRKDIKILQTKLYNWIIALNYDNLKIDTPNHSQRIRLI
ncbi:MAG: hypothetical protein HFJ28_01985 [Clostridia bacterium]|nr:hypothetical protein [Clostridia bacterium]